VDRTKSIDPLLLFLELTIPAHLHDAVMQLPPEQRRARTAVNEARPGATLRTISHKDASP
jgi:hypothetical protein